MKKFIRVLSVVLSVLTVLSSAAVMSFAADEQLPGTAVSDSAVTEETPKEESLPETDDRNDMNPVSGKSTESSGGVQIGDYYFIRPYDELLKESFDKAADMISGGVRVPAAIAEICFVFPPLWLLLPLAVSAGAVYGAGSSVAGVFAIIFSPLTALINFLF